MLKISKVCSKDLHNSLGDTVCCTMFPAMDMQCYLNEKCISQQYIDCIIMSAKMHSFEISFEDDAKRSTDACKAEM